MTTNAMLGAHGWVAQKAKDTMPASDFVANKIYWHQVVAGDFSVQQLQRPYDYEVGGTPLIPGTYKGGVWSGGTLAIQPRLHYQTGVLNGLAAIFATLAGSFSAMPATATVTTDTLPTAVLGVTAGTGNALNMGLESTDHVLFFPGGQGSVQFGVDRGDGNDYWLTFRRVIPGSTPVGETYYNCKIAGLTMTVGPGAPVRLDISAIGGAGNNAVLPQIQMTTSMPASDGWNYATAADVSTIPLGCQGFFKVGPATSAPLLSATNLTITIASNITPPNQMLVVGQYTPYDYATLSRSVGVSFTHLWENPDLYRQIYYGSATGTQWSPQVFTSPVFVKLATPDNAYRMGFFAQMVDFMARPIGLQGESIVVMQVEGIVRNTSSADWALWIAHSGLSGMTAWPT